MQECRFPIELIISNDCSPDNTNNIINNIIKNHPKSDIIRYINHEKNIGMMPNFISALRNVNSKYVAICEGDDYWIDRFKLQKQVDFMEKNLDFSMCFHSVQITMAHKNDYYIYETPSSDVLFLKDIIKNHYIPTCSLLFRNNNFCQRLPLWLSKSISGDIPVEIILASQGKTKYLSEKMACYRRNEGGITQSPLQLSKMRMGYIYMYSRLAQEIVFPYNLHLYYIVFRLRLGYLKIWYKKIRSFLIKNV